MNGCLPTSVSSQIDFFSPECEFRTIHLSMLNVITSVYQDMILSLDILTIHSNFGNLKNLV